MTVVAEPNDGIIHANVHSVPYDALPPSLTTALRTRLDNTFERATEDALTMHEPQVVRALGSRIAADCHGLTGDGHRVHAYTGFIHQQSYVRFLMAGTRKLREAGDLLVVCTRITATGSSTRAVLFQAKIFTTLAGLSRMRTGDAQHFLYHYWPQISYTWGQTAGTTTRAIGGDRKFQGSRYLMIRGATLPAIGAGVCVTADNEGLGAPEPATTYVLNMLRDHAAVPYEALGPGDWNGLVDDLRQRVTPAPAPRAGRRTTRLDVGTGSDGEGGLVVVHLWVVADGADPLVN